MVFLGMVVMAGCSSGQAAGPSPSATPSDAARLGAGLLSAPDGMSVAYGPETGAYGSLKATRQGMAALKDAKVSEPGCAGAGQLDPAKLGAAPAAVVAYSSKDGSITQAIVATDFFPGPVPARCASYKAEVSGAKVTYRTVPLKLPARGERSFAFLTTAVSDGEAAQIGAVVIGRKGVVTSLLVIGAKVKKEGLAELARLADEKLARITRQPS
ncbi:hypothetical protein ACIBEJ_38750 [Nonomuraea sp. NPDC050790]|uniref:hypothetical protein n=1 Tax=Nonomuraea sp. NPDC050790 TaxID=3364371 RepID=UPI003791CEC0